MRKVTGFLTLAMMGVWVTSAYAGSPISFHLAGTKPIDGFQKMALDSSALYVAPQATLSGERVTSADAIDARNGTDVELTVRPETARKLAAAMKQHQADRLVAMAGGRILGSGTATVDAKDGRITITGLKPLMARRLSRVLSGASITQLGPAIKLAPSTNSVSPGGTFTVDVFAANMPDFRVYQIALDIVGGTHGQLSVSDLLIDSDRSDFVFRDQKKIDAVDKMGGRLGALAFDGSISVGQPMYLGMFELTASADAAGSFDVSVRMADSSSFVKGGGNQSVDFFTDGAITITVGEAERIRGSAK